MRSDHTPFVVYTWRREDGGKAVGSGENIYTGIRNCYTESNACNVVWLSAEFQYVQYPLVICAINFDVYISYDIIMSKL